MNNDIEILKKKLVYRSQYRGTKEMDKLVGSFVKNCIDKLDYDELHELENFLDLDDDILYKLFNNQIKDSKSVNKSIINMFKRFEYK